MSNPKYKYCGIYKIKIDKYEYVGQSKNITNRIAQHKKKLKYNIHPNKYLQNVYNKYKTFEYNILWKGEEVYLTILEQTFINISENNLNLAPAGKSYNKTKAQRKSLSESMKSSDKVKQVLKRIHYQPKTNKQIEASKQSVKSMNTPEANAKSKASRQNNVKVKSAMRNRITTDDNIYIFENRKTKEVFSGKRWEFQEYLQTNYNYKKFSSARTNEIMKGQSYKDWVLQEGQLVIFKGVSNKRIKGVNNPCADSTIYSFVHTKTQEVFIGNRFSFAEKLNVKSNQLTGLLNCYDKTYHKWKLNASKLI